MKRRHTRKELKQRERWIVIQLTLFGRVLICSEKMKLNEHKARNLVENNKRKGMHCEAEPFRPFAGWRRNHRHAPAPARPLSKGSYAPPARALRP